VTRRRFRAPALCAATLVGALIASPHAGARPPGDFPEYEFQRAAKPAAPFYLVAPETESAGRYVAVFDRRGVPVWWYEAKASPFDAKVLPDGTFTWNHYYGGAFSTDPRSAYELRRADGRLVGRLRTVGGVTDNHDLQPTPDGNYLLLSYRKRAAVDASAVNGDASATVYDGVVQKLTRRGKLLWEWSTAGRIGLEETGRWWADLEEPYDIVHINAVEPLAGGDFLISLRNTDAVYRVDRPSGRIVWKLGGSPTPESLAVAGDPLGAYPLGAQHDVRLRPDGAITVFDNGTALGRPPRAVRYRIDGNTATLTAEITDAEVGASPYTGSARLAHGRWLISWGGHPLVAEYRRDGTRVFGLTFSAPYSYRAIAIDGELTRRELRRGMDAMAR
jgi:Arylsulfotransferase (ASST)